MYSLETICHTNIKKSRLFDIIRIKSSAWKYPLEEQLQRIDKNITSSDIHCILKSDNIDVAYLNLIDINLIIDNSLYKGYGIGNVCSKAKGQGYGSALMENVNLYIKQCARVGMLFCKNDLLSFYARFGWIEVPQARLQISMNFANANIMVYNCPNDFHCLKFRGLYF